MATLMRIAALFVPSSTCEENIEATADQDSPTSSPKFAADVSLKETGRKATPKGSSSAVPGSLSLCSEAHQTPSRLKGMGKPSSVPQQDEAFLQTESQIQAGAQRRGEEYNADSSKIPGDGEAKSIEDPSTEDETLKQAAAVVENATIQYQEPKEASKQSTGHSSPQNPLESSDGDPAKQGVVPEGSEREPVDSADRFSVEVVRCRAVCPDWQDPALNEAGTNARPDTLVLGIPRLLLQLPVSDPAVQPVQHPVEVCFVPQEATKSF